MKKSLIILSSFAIAVICSSSTLITTDTNTNSADTQPKKVVFAKADIAKGKALLPKSDCLACHKIDAKVVGPAYNDVALKYKDTEANVKYLSGKIIKGGAGVWGQVPMSPHPTLTVADARNMAKYILSLK
jgi:cytochrome c